MGVCPFKIQALWYTQNNKLWFQLILPSSHPNCPRINFISIMSHLSIQCLSLLFLYIYMYLLNMYYMQILTHMVYSLTLFKLILAFKNLGFKLCLTI